MMHALSESVQQSPHKSCGVLGRTKRRLPCPPTHRRDHITAAHEPLFARNPRIKFVRNINEDDIWQTTVPDTKSENKNTESFAGSAAPRGSNSSGNNVSKSCNGMSTWLPSFELKQFDVEIEKLGDTVLAPGLDTHTANLENNNNNYNKSCEQLTINNLRNINDISNHGVIQDSKREEINLYVTSQDQEVQYSPSTKKSNLTLPLQHSFAALSISNDVKSTIDKTQPKRSSIKGKFPNVFMKNKGFYNQHTKDIGLIGLLNRPIDYFRRSKANHMHPEKLSEGCPDIKSPWYSPVDEKHTDTSTQQDFSRNESFKSNTDTKEAELILTAPPKNVNMYGSAKSESHAGFFQRWSECIPVSPTLPIRNSQTLSRCESMLEDHVVSPVSILSFFSVGPHQGTEACTTHHVTDIDFIGSVEFTMQYLVVSERFKVTVVRASGLGGKNKGDHSLNTYAQACLMPSKVQKQNSKTVKRSRNPRFDFEMFFNDIKMDDLRNMRLRIKIQPREHRLRPRKCLGEVRIPLKDFDLVAQTRMSQPLLGLSDSTK